MGRRTPGFGWQRNLFGTLAVVTALAACGSPQPPDAVPTLPTLMVSVSPDRRGAFALDGSVVDGEIYVQLVPPQGSVVVEVRFYLDDATGTPFQVETSAPFDLAGGVADAANPLDTAALADGAHEIVAEWWDDSGGQGRVTAGFTVSNPHEADPIPPDVPTEGSWYVSVAGDDLAAGSAEAPFASIQRAVDAALPGDVILVREGEYRLSQPIRITVSGTAKEPIVLAAFPGERVVLDGSHMDVVKPMVKLTASYWELYDLEIRAGPSFGLLMMDAEHNVLRRLETHHNGHSGVHLGEGASYNLIVDCASHDNYDPASGGENADGFAIKHRTAVANTVLRSAAWHNSDDGFDLLDSPPQRIDRSVAYGNGLMPDGTPYPNGNGNGFKLGIGAGRYEPGGGHLVTRSVAWGNEVWGFNSNNGTVPITLYNNTAWRNGEYDFFFHKAAHVLANNLSYGGKVWTGAEVVAERNSWQIELRETPFRSTDPEDPEFLWLVPDGPAVDEGRDVGLAYAGAAPDLGAFEVGDTSVSIGLGHAWELMTALAGIDARTWPR